MARLNPPVSRHPTVCRCSSHITVIIIGADFEKDKVLCEVPFGGVLFLNNLIPHRRFVLIIQVAPDWQLGRILLGI